MITVYLVHVLVHNGPVNSIHFHPSGNYLLSGSTDKTLKVCLGLISISARYFIPHISGVGFTRRTTILYSSWSQGLKNETHLAMLSFLPQGPVMGVNFSPTGEFFASVGLDEQVWMCPLNYSITYDFTGAGVEN